MIYKDRKGKRGRLLPYLFLTPALLVLALTILYPMVSNLAMSMQRVQLLKGSGGEFIGVGNYAKLAGSQTFRSSLLCSLEFVGLSLPLVLVLGLALALLLNELRKGRPLLMACLLIPWAISPVVTGYMWRWLFHDSFGLVNHLLVSVGLVREGIPWLARPGPAMAAVVTANVWRFMPYTTIMLLAGLQGIPKNLYEAAHVDGAGVARRFWHITLPQLRHVLAVVFLFATIWMVNEFPLIFIMTEGGPAKATQVLPITIYQIAFEHLRLGRGAAASMVLLAFLLLASILFIRLLFREEVGDRAK
jgi:multiple sugar transport system permease protein